MTVLYRTMFFNKTSSKNYNIKYFCNVFLKFFLLVRVFKIYRGRHMSLILMRGGRMQEIACQYKQAQLVLQVVGKLCCLFVVVAAVIIVVVIIWV